MQKPHYEIGGMALSEHYTPSNFRKGKTDNTILDSVVLFSRDQANQSNSKVKVIYMNVCEF